MKGIIIENEWEVDINIQALIKDNPELFESIDEQLHCLHRSTEDLLPHILKNDAIICSSTWMYKDQLNDFLDGFLNPKFPKKIIFAYSIASTLNKWKHEYSEEKELFGKVKQLLKKGFIIYDFIEDSFKEVVEDKLTVFNQGMFGDDKIRKRHKYSYFLLKYSKKYDLFYTDHKYTVLKEVREDEQQEIKRSSR